MHVELPVGHARPVLHAWFTQAPPAVVTALHVPHCESGARAQKVLVH
jgi:hypothetical protein